MNTLAAAAEAEAEAEAQEERRRAEAPAQDAPALPPRAPRTLLLPQDMPMEERPHCMLIYLLVYRDFLCCIIQVTESSQIFEV